MKRERSEILGYPAPSYLVSTNNNNKDKNKMCRREIDREEQSNNDDKQKHNGISHPRQEMSHTANNIRNRKLWVRLSSWDLQIP